MLHLFLPWVPPFCLFQPWVQRLELAKKVPQLRRRALSLTSDSLRPPPEKWASVSFRLRGKNGTPTKTGPNVASKSEHKCQTEKPLYVHRKMKPKWADCAIYLHPTVNHPFAPCSLKSVLAKAHPRPPQSAWSTAARRPGRAKYNREMPTLQHHGRRTLSISTLVFQRLAK